MIDYFTNKKSIRLNNFLRESRAKIFILNIFDLIIFFIG